MIDLSKKDLRALPGAIYESILALWRGERPTGLAQEVDAATRSGCPEKFGVGGLVLPLETLHRALTVGTFTGGGALVDNEQGPIDPIPRKASVVRRAGAQVITGLKGNLTIGRETATSTIGWKHEIEDVSATDGTFGALNLTPHRISGATTLSNQLDAQTGGQVTRFLLQSFVEGVGQAVDEGALVGTGVTGQPSGLYAAADVLTVTFGGAATLAKVADMEEQVTTNNANDEALSFIAHPKVREKWRTIARLSNGGSALWDNDGVLGRPSYVTSAMAATDICCGDFSKMIVAFWGEGTPIQLIVDPYSQSPANKIQIVVNAFADTGLLRPTVFCRNTDTATA